MSIKFNISFLLILLFQLTLLAGPRDVCAKSEKTEKSEHSSKPDQLSDDAAIYLSGEYDTALAKFQQLDKDAPENARTQYYLGLCSMRLRDQEAAAKYFELMKKFAKDEQSKLLAETWLARIERHQKHISDNYSISAPTVAKENEPVIRVLWFFTNWCPKCKRFREHFNNAETLFPSLKFEQINSEDPQNWELVSKYKVRSYPTLVYFGKNGKIIENFAGAPMGNTFNEHLMSMGAKPAEPSLPSVDDGSQSLTKQGKTK